MDTIPWKFGSVEVSDDALVFDQHGVRGTLSNALVGRSRWRSAALPAIVVVLLIASGHPLLAAGYGVFAGYYFYKGRNFTLVRRLEREEVLRIEAVSGVPWLTLDRLAVHYRRGGSEHVRFIMMPTRLQGGSAEDLAQGVATLSARGWPVEASTP